MAKRVLTPEEAQALGLESPAPAAKRRVLSAQEAAEIGLPVEAQPAQPAGPQVGAGETFLNRTASALPLGKQLTNAVSTLLLQNLKHVGGLGEPGAKLTPQALAEAQAQGIPVGNQGNTVPGVVDTYRDFRDTFGERTAAGSDQNKLEAGLGTATGLGLSLLAPLPKATVGSGATGRIASNALTGGSYGFVNSAANSRGDLLKGEFGQIASDALGVEGLKQAGKDFGEKKYGRALLNLMGAGALGGGLTGGALSSSVEGVRASGLPQKAGDALRRVAGKKALNALGAQRPEFRKLGDEAVQEAGQYALDKGIVTPLASKAKMGERIAAGKREAGGRIDDALNELDAAALPAERVDPLAAATKLEAMADDMAHKPALASVANKFRNEAAQIRSSAGASAPGGQRLTEFESNVARPYKENTNWSADVKAPAKVLKRLPMALEGEVERAAAAISKRTGSDAAQRYGTAKSDYGALAKLGQISKKGLEQQANNTFGLKDIGALVAGSTAGAAGGPVGSASLGLLSLLGSKALNRYGDQLAATAANRASRLLTSPGQGGKAGEAAAILGNALRAREPVGGLTPAMANLTDEEKAVLLQYAEALQQEKNR